MTEEKTNSSFAVAITPEFDDNGEWSGSVTAHIEEDIRDDLNEEQVHQIRSVCGMMAACLPLMEEDSEFLDYVKDFFYANYEQLVEEMLADMANDKPNFTRSSDGKVITLDFDTKTHGSA